jgi:endoglucanase
LQSADFLSARYFGVFLFQNEKRNGQIAFEFVKTLGTGINLAHAFEAFEKHEGGDYETAWGNPAVTKEVIDAIADAGFSSVRIPVTWAVRTGGAPEYTIDAAFFQRIGEVVDWVIGAGMIAVVNMHHDDFFWYIPDSKHENQVSVQYEKMWLQIAAYFKDYGQALAFEAFNEPRVIGSATEWSGGTVFTRNVLNRLNKIFINAVRTSGGQNTTRFLFIPTYGGSSEGNAVRGLLVQKNDVRLIVAVHYYKPRDFATERDMNAVNFTEKDKKEIDKTFALLEKTFVKKGIPVVIDEFAAYDKNNPTQRAAYAAYIINKAQQKNMTAFWWDNGVNLAGNLPDAFGLIDRKTCEFKYPEILFALTGRSN